ncbi:MAG: hypothetical protein ACE14T_03685 [Syntrophales bacterium]
MKPEHILDVLETLIEFLPDESPEDKHETYAAILILADDLKKYARQKNIHYAYVSGKIASFLKECSFISRLSKGEPGIARHLASAYRHLKALRSEAGLDIRQ